MMTHLLIPRGCSRDYDDLFAREYLDVYAREVDGLGMYVPPACDFCVPDIDPVVHSRDDFQWWL